MSLFWLFQRSMIRVGRRSCVSHYYYETARLILLDQLFVNFVIRLTQNLDTIISWSFVCVFLFCKSTETWSPSQKKNVWSQPNAKGKPNKRVLPMPHIRTLFSFGRVMLVYYAEKGSVLFAAAETQSQVEWVSTETKELNTKRLKRGSIQPERKADSGTAVLQWQHESKKKKRIDFSSVLLVEIFSFRWEQSAWSVSLVVACRRSVLPIRGVNRKEGKPSRKSWRFKFRVFLEQIKLNNRKRKARKLCGFSPKDHSDNVARKRRWAPHNVDETSTAQTNDDQQDNVVKTLFDSFSVRLSVHRVHIDMKRDRESRQVCYVTR